jgi:DNA-binding FrmR family transcriptional regulator
MSVRDDSMEAILRRLHRIEGQIRGITRMIEESKDCEDILTQVAAARSALDRVGIHMITHHMKECLADKTFDSSEEAISQAIEIFVRFSSNIGPVGPEA